MTKPTVSSYFNVDDIRKIREYNSLRHVNMTSEEIIEDTRKGASELLEKLKNRKKINATS